MHIHSVLESREESHKVTRKGFRRDTGTETLSCGAPSLRQRPPAPAYENPDSQIPKAPLGDGAKPTQPLPPTSGGTKGPAVGPQTTAASGLFV